jgi:hypothetical protein
MSSCRVLKAFNYSFQEAEGAEREVRFPEGTVIYPARFGRGVLQGDLIAEKIEGKIKGLTGYRAKCQVVLYFDQHFWTLNAGQLFGAYSKDAHKVANHR